MFIYKLYCTKNLLISSYKTAFMKDIKLYLKTQNRYMFIYTYRALINFEHHLN